MRLTLILLLALVAFPVVAQPADSVRAAGEFLSTVQSFQTLYMRGEDDDCNEITEVLDEDLVFQENGESWTKAEMVQYCPHLPYKEIIDTIAAMSYSRMI